MRIALLGGSFDPVHNAHLALALQAKSQLQADQVQLIPAAQPWQRQALGATPDQRLAMLRLALATHSGLVINDIEIQRGGPTYTLDTVQNLPTGHEYFWLLGSDQLNNFCTWKNWQAILRYVNLAVAQRPGSELAAPKALQTYLLQANKKLQIIQMDAMAISSTQIRQNIQQGLEINDYVPDSVLRYIQQHNLYLNTD